MIDVIANQSDGIAAAMDFAFTIAALVALVALIVWAAGIARRAMESDEGEE